MRLKELRTAKKYTQQKVAEKICCATRVYARYESEQRQPHIDILIKLAELYNVSVDYIIGRDTALGTSITESEAKTIAALRHADERARDDALTLLNKHSRNK